MSLKAKLEAIIYAAETPVTLDQLIELVKESLISDGAADGTEIKSRVRLALEELVVDYYSPDHGIEIRQVAGGYRMSTKPEHHDIVRAFAKSLKPPIRLSLPALETLAVIAYKQPVTVPEISEIRGVDSNGVIATLLDRKLITTAGRKAVIGRPILYKTTKEFLMRFGLKDIGELPSMEEFEKLVAESFQSDLLPVESETQEPELATVEKHLSGESDPAA
jgi:segregation and condensation protein B